jgi:hypothetical protein
LDREPGYLGHSVHERPVEDGDTEAGLFEQPIRPLAQRPVREIL